MILSEEQKIQRAKDLAEKAAKAAKRRKPVSLEEKIEKLKQQQTTIRPSQKVRGQIEKGEKILAEREAKKAVDKEKRDIAAKEKKEKAAIVAKQNKEIRMAKSKAEKEKKEAEKAAKKALEKAKEEEYKLHLKRVKEENANIRKLEKEEKAKAKGPKKTGETKEKKEKKEKTEKKVSVVKVKGPQLTSQERFQKMMEGKAKHMQILGEAKYLFETKGTAPAFNLLMREGKVIPKYLEEAATSQAQKLYLAAQKEKKAKRAQRRANTFKNAELKPENK